MGRRSRTARPRPGPGPDRESDPARTRTPTPTPTSPSSPPPRDQRVPVTDGNESSAHQPTTGDGTSPDPVAPDNSHAPQPPVAPGHRDLPWKATAERRDLWGPTQRPLEGQEHSPADPAPLGPPRPRPPRTFGRPVLGGDRRTAGPVGTHPAAPRGEGALAREHRLHRPPPAPPAGDLRGAGAGRRSHRHRSARVGTGCRTGRPAARGRRRPRGGSAGG